MFVVLNNATYEIIQNFFAFTLVLSDCKRAPKRPKGFRVFAQSE